MFQRIILASIFSFLLVHNSYGYEIPLMIPYSGTVSVDGVKYDGRGEFKFAIVSSSCNISGAQVNCETIWSNDNTSKQGHEPESSVVLTVIDGKFQVKLGDTSHQNMNDIGKDTFDQQFLYLRVWFNDGTNGFQRLDNDRELGSVPFSYVAQKAAEVLPGSVDGEHIKHRAININHVDSDSIQARILGECFSGTAISSIDSMGSVVCTELDSTSTTSNNFENDGIVIVDGKVSYSNITPDAIGTTQIKDQSISSEDIALNSIDERHLGFVAAKQADLETLEQEVTAKAAQLAATNSEIERLQQIVANKTDLAELAQSSVPIGGIIDWWRPNDSVEVPIGFVICDGKMITDSRSPYVGEIVPNLFGKFTLAVGLENLGEEGGSETHSHTTDIDHNHNNVASTRSGNHSHQTDITHNHTARSFESGDHTHNTSISHGHPSFKIDGGAHTHVSLRWDTNINQWRDGSGYLLTNWENGEDNAGSGRYSLSVDGPTPTFNALTSETSHEHDAQVPYFSGIAQSTEEGAHTHVVTVDTYVNRNRQSTASGVHEHSVDLPALGTTNKQSTEASNLPPYVGLVKLMRIF